MAPSLHESIDAQPIKPETGELCSTPGLPPGPREEARTIEFIFGRLEGMQYHFKDLLHVAIPESGYSKKLPQKSSLSQF
jgi:hypothetical protein